MFLRDATEIIWAFTGTVIGLIMCVGISAIVRQIRHNSTGSSQADRWENATDSVMGFLDGDEARMARFSKLLKAAETRPIVIEALSNSARTNANCAVRLRDRDADLAVLRQWVSDSLEDKDAGRRAHACEVVATLRLRTCRGMILAATSDEDVNVKVSARRAMAVIDPESAVGVLLGLIEDEGTWVADFLADLLQRIPASATEAVVLRAREWGAIPALVKRVSKPVASTPALRQKPFVSEPTAAKPVESEPKPVVSKPVGSKASVSKPVGSKASGSKSVGSKASGLKASVSKPVGSKASVSKSLAATSTESKTVLAPQPTIPNPADKQGRRSDNVLAWLEAFLVAKDGVASAPLVKAAAAAEGIAERTLERVRPSIATSARQGFGEPANWELITKRARDVAFV